MKRSGLFIKLMSVLLTFCFVFSIIAASPVLSANGAEYNDNYENMSSAEKQAYLEQKVKEFDQKLSTLGNQSRETEDYIDTLNEKIGFLQRELQLAKTTIDNSQKKIKSLESQYKENEDEIKALQQDITGLGEKEEELQAEFNVSYDQYCERAKAMYISGTTSTLAMLITSDDISTLFTRLEMIKRVAKSDKQLLEGLQLEGEELLETKSELENKRSDLVLNQQKLINTKEDLTQTIKSLELQQTSYNEKEKTYEAQRAEADNLLLNLHNQTNNYSEFRNQSLQELKEINAEIEKAALEWQKRQEQATATTTTTTTTTTTSHNDDSEREPSSEKTTTAKKPTTSTAASSNKLQMTFPVPSQKKITCGYGSAGYAGHTGVDFACDSGSRVVAAEDGEVIISKDITCNRSTCKNSYHGDGYCSYGKYIVIAHYKKNSKGDYVYTLYAHNSSRLVSVGDKVSKGQLIAYSGSTGNSTGPHCHFEVRTPTASYSDCVNPTPYLP